MTSTSVSNPDSAKLYHRSSQVRAPLERQSFDQQYLDRLAQGESETCVHFAQYFTKLLVMKLRAKFNSPCQAEDAAQETLLRVLKHLRDKGGIEFPERLGAFVHSVCDHVVLEFYRAGNRFQQIPENAPEPVSQAINAEFNCITDERKALIAKSLGQLRETDRVIIEKVFLLEQDKDEICRDLGIDRNYLRVQVHRALARFRSILSASESSPSKKTLTN